jgi:hypothetical protein
MEMEIAGHEFFSPDGKMHGATHVYAVELGKYNL